jgi:hypothetical protein
MKLEDRRRRGRDEALRVALIGGVVPIPWSGSDSFNMENAQWLIQKKTRPCLLAATIHGRCVPCDMPTVNGQRHSSVSPLAELYLSLGSFCVSKRLG